MGIGARAKKEPNFSKELTMSSNPFSTITNGGVQDPSIPNPDNQVTPANQPTAEEQAKVQADAAVAQVQAQVTEVKSSNTLAEAEAKEQAKVIEMAKPTVSEDDAEPGDIVHTAEQGSHKLTTTKVNGLNHNFFSRCTCQWEGRFVSLKQAADGALQHLARNIKKVL